jgi:hypothetical protein
MAKIANLPQLTPIVPDDPTSPTTAPTAPSVATTAETPVPGVVAVPPPRPPTGLADLADLDAWSGITSAATHKLPVELLKLLDKRMSAVGLTKTATISAALVELLSYDDAELVRRVDAFQERYERARRRAKRTAY